MSGGGGGTWGKATSYCKEPCSVKLHIIIYYLVSV